MDNTADLRVLLESRHPLLLVETLEEERFLSILAEVTAELQLPIWSWSATRGLRRTGHSSQYGTASPLKALEFVSYLSAPGIFVFADAHPILADPTVVRAVKETARGALPGQTLVLTAPRLETPPELEEMAHRWTLRPPDRKELRLLIERTTADLSERGFSVDLAPDTIEDLASALAGLAIKEAERLIQRAALAGAVDDSAIPRIRAAKAELLAGDGVLELVESSRVTLEQLGGFTGIKEWLRIRTAALARDTPGLDPLRGILLTGVPGCGKSLLAKALAASWEIPLVLLDPARLYSKYIGESEQRLGASLDTIDAMAPVVLWIDEIEKGFATGAAADGGVSRRLLGTFLRWMQERSGRVFLVATANDVSSLPPELLRKGRFDEVFFVDLPDVDARREILRIHLEGRQIDVTGVDVDRLAEETDGFSGAELETAVVAALYRAVAADVPLTTAQLTAEIAATVPLAVSQAEDVRRLRRWASTRAVPA